MRQRCHQLLVETAGQRLYEITREVESWVAAQGIAQGLLTLFIHHTSASLLIQENADPRVQDDLNAFFRRLVSEERQPLHPQRGRPGRHAGAHPRGADRDPARRSRSPPAAPTSAAGRGSSSTSTGPAAASAAITLHLLGE